MPAAPIPVHELKRVAAVQKTRLLGTPAEERFDQITRLARRMFNVPMAIIDIVGEKLAWLKSVQGFDRFEVAREHSYCHVISYGAKSLDALLRRADTELYRAKHGGRNRLEIDTSGQAADDARPLVSAPH